MKNAAATAAMGRTAESTATAGRLAQLLIADPVRALGVIETALHLATAQWDEQNMPPDLMVRLQIAKLRGLTREAMKAVEGNDAPTV